MLSTSYRHKSTDLILRTKDLWPSFCQAETVAFSLFLLAKLIGAFQQPEDADPPAHSLVLGGATAA